MQFDCNIRQTEVYLDNAATTIMDERVVAAMVPFLAEKYGNPETPYHLGQEAREAIDIAREKIARVISADPGEIYFTSGGTEANNWAIKGQVGCSGMMVGAAEHASVVEPARWMQSRGIQLTEIPVDQDGVVDLEFIGKGIGSGVNFVSVQHSNNEVGTLQPVSEISKLCKSGQSVRFHCDACQSYGKVPIDVYADGYDFVSISAHKIHGPMGVGALWIKKGVPIEPLLHGGRHQSGMRAGTLAVPMIVGFGVAAELAWSEMKKTASSLSVMIDELAHTLNINFKAVRNGHKKDRLPNILNITIPSVDVSVLVGLLARDGICVSMGSACNTSVGKSSVLRAMGRSHADCGSSLRISLSRFTDRNDVLSLVSRLQAAMRELPKMEDL